MLPLFLQGNLGQMSVRCHFPSMRQQTAEKTNKPRDLQFSVNKVSFTAPTV